jgi:ubiquitin-conjugating enzyme E2 G1
MSATSAAGSLLRRQLKEMQKSKDLPGISCGLVSDSNFFEWEVMLMINDDCKYYGGSSLRLLIPNTSSNVPRACSNRS